MYRPIYNGKNQNEEEKNCFFLLYCMFTLPKTPITFWGVFGKKSACMKTPESHAGFLVRGAHAWLLAAFDRSAQYVAGRGWFPGRSRPTWPQTQIKPARGERAFTLAKNSEKLVEFQKTTLQRWVFLFEFFFAVFRGNCLATSNETLECEKNSGFLCQCKQLYCLVTFFCVWLNCIIPLKHRDSFGKEKFKNNTCSIFDKTLSKVFLNNFHALNRS